MSESARNAGTAAGRPYKIEHAGKEYSFGPADQLAMKRWEDLWWTAEKLAVKAARDCYTTEEYVAALDAVARRYGAGAYSLRGEAGLKRLLSTAPGILSMLSVLGDYPVEELGTLMLALPAELGELFKDILLASGLVMTEGPEKNG